MSHITLVRHGQANTGARDEESYDKLSPLGHQQAAWLGAHLRACGDTHARVYTGTLRRHIETADSMGLCAATRDPRLNEIEYFTLAELMQAQHGLAIPEEREGFVEHLPRVFTAWQNGEIADPPETFEAFETRVHAVLHEIGQGPGPAIAVTSGALISMVMRQVLDLDTRSMARVALAIMNTSVHRVHPIGPRLSPVLFNSVPHLDPPDRHYARTHL